MILEVCKVAGPGSNDETGDEAEDPNESLTMRTPFTALRLEQNPKRVARPCGFCNKNPPVILLLLGI